MIRCGLFQPDRFLYSVVLLILVFSHKKRVYGTGRDLVA